MRYLILFLLASSLWHTAAAQRPVVTTDIDHFWQAYDSVATTTDHARQLDFITRLYVNRGTPGLVAFSKARGYSAPQWVDLLNRYPAFWRSIRPNTLLLQQQAPQLVRSTRRLRRLYPALRPATIYFTIGGLKSGGTVSGDTVLIGSEMAAGTAQTDVSEFSDGWLATIFQQQSLQNVVALTVHEYVHTQQRGSDQATTVLAQALKEGSCDFIAELVTGQPLRTGYMTYGAAHAAEVRARFKQDMFSDAYSAWLYNGTSKPIGADLGYYMGYAICRAYYQQAASKKQAIKDIIELNYASPVAIEGFLRQSGYYAEPWDKEALLAAFHAKQPRVLTVQPADSSSAPIRATTRQLIIQFDQEMDGTRTSFEPGPLGKQHFPLKRPVGFSADKRSYVVEVDLQPNTEYEFIVTRRGFRSKDGYALRQDYPIRFKTN